MEKESDTRVIHTSVQKKRDRENQNIATNVNDCDQEIQKLTYDVIKKSMEDAVHYVLNAKLFHASRQVWYWPCLLRLASVLKTILHQCVISYTCSQSYSDGSVLKQSHQSKTGYKYML